MSCEKNSSCVTVQATHHQHALGLGAVGLQFGPRRIDQKPRVRGDARGLMGPEKSQAPAPRHDFVGNKEDVVLFGYIKKRSQFLGCVHAHAAGTLHQRFQDDGGLHNGVRIRQPFPRPR